MITNKRSKLCLVAISVVLLGCLCEMGWRTTAKTAQPVTLSFGKPSIWTLAQAHYLLAQMRQTDQALAVSTPGVLDPNAINRQKIEILQTLLGVTAEFDQGALVKNRILQQRYDANFGRQQTVIAELDRRTNDLIQANRELYSIDADLTRLQSATPPDAAAIKLKQAEHDSKTVEKQSISDRITALNSELSSLRAENISNNTPQFSGPSAQSSPLPLTPKLSGLIDKAFLDQVFTESKNTTGQLQASNRLDNYIQMQYELISKQLTLLRDEVSPNERVIFLELPISIYSVPKSGDDYIAQVHWKLEQYCKHSGQPSASPSPRMTPTSSPDRFQRDTETLASQLGISPEDSPQRRATLDVKCFESSDAPKLDVNSARTVDIIPRQSVLNVNTIHNTSNGFAFAARFMALFGFGAKVDYERQREVYDQFVQQDVFASGFGKGSNNFGWTFGPQPGTKILIPGVRTTYAVLVLPKEAEKIKITAEGSAFRRTSEPPSGCDNSESFYIDVPNENVNGFWVDSADYESVQPGKRVSLILGGNFSPQVGVLINGVPLQRTVAISPFTTTPVPSGSPDNRGNSAAVVGEYEYVNSERLVAWLQMGSDYEGTPVIALVTPEKTSIINGYHIDVNHKHWDKDSLKLHSLLEPMFLKPLNIGTVQIVKKEQNTCDRGKDYVYAVLSGTGFRGNAEISVNGEPVPAIPGLKPDRTCGLIDAIEQRSTHQYNVIFKDPVLSSWEITLRQNAPDGQEEDSATVSRPFAPHVTYDILRYTGGSERRNARLDLRLVGPQLQQISEVKLLNDGSVSDAIVCVDPDAPAPSPEKPARRRRRRRHAHSEAKPINKCIRISSDEVVVTLNLGSRPRNETLILLVKGDKGEYTILNILPPAPPKITSIVNEATKKAEGSPDGGYAVVIRGDNLGQVERVYFGSKPATIQQSGPGILTVMVPKGEEGAVRVLLETNTPYQNKFLSNSEDFADAKETRAIFTYVKPKT